MHKNNVKFVKVCGDDRLDYSKGMIFPQSSMAAGKAP
jgi:hypothetical protein